MSRTGVGCRVMIDGNLLDDGCINWEESGEYGAPWTEIRRNLVKAPRPEVTSNSGWGGATVVDGEWLVRNDSGVSTAYIFSSMATEAIAIGDVLSAKITFMVTAMGATTATHIRACFHARVGNAYYQNVQQVLPILLNVEQTFEFTWAATAAVDINNLDIAIVSASASGGFMSVQPGFSMRARRPIIERGPVVGEFFDGDIADAGAVAYSWLGGVQNSASVEEVGTWIPDESGTVGQGVSAVEGLSIAWGRSTTVDQPSASSCSFTVIDDPGGVALLETFAIGQRVDVYADAIISGGTAEPDAAFTDPDFATEVRAVATNATVTRTQAEIPAPDEWSARILLTQPGVSARVQFPPGTIQAPGTNPAAWATLQTTNPGETWTISMKVRVPYPMNITMRPLLYSGPYAASAYYPVIAGEEYVIGGYPSWEWVPVTFQFPPGDTAWVGFQIDTYDSFTWDDPGTSTWDDIEATRTWDDYRTVYIADVVITAPGEGTARTVQVFNGRITDLEGYYDDALDAPMVNITASDLLADLGNRYIGDEPWPLEPFETRIGRIVAAAAVPGEAPIATDIPATVAAIPLTWEDVDHRAVSGLFTDAAQSVDVVLWAASHPILGPFIRYEDPALRTSPFQLALVDGEIVIIAIGRATAPPVAVSACDMLRDPVSFEMSVADVSTRVGVTWLEQPTDPNAEDASTTEHTFEVINAGRESIYGTRAVSVTTQLTAEADAMRVADQMIGRLGADWRIEGLVLDDADLADPAAAAASALLTLLDSVTRGGQPVTITDLAEWSPLGESTTVYLEGGGYTFEGGGWALSMTVSRATGLGESATWDDVPTDPGWTWDAWAAGTTWNDLRGVAGPGSPVPPPRPRPQSKGISNG